MTVSGRISPVKITHCWLLASVVLLLTGWVRPAKPVREQDSRVAALDAVVFEVNGERRLVRSGSELVVIQGDTLEVIDATLSNRKARISEVNVIGFPGSRTADDRRQKFATTSLMPKFSEANRGQVYAVAVSGQGSYYGSVYIRIEEPLLQFAEVEINGVPRVLREGEPVRLSAVDKIKVRKVKTNLFSDEGVYFQIADTEPPAQGRYEIRFARGDHVFARIPLHISNE